MASPYSFTSQNYNFNVFVSSHGPDVPKTLLSHLREQFKRNGIPMFDDQEIERSATISPSLIEAIRNSRISIVILSKKYASSSWCLNELVEILKCKRTMGQIVMPIFYDMDPSDVRKQTGDFGIGFNETCKGKMEDERQKWSQALIEVGNIAGEEFFQWDNESKMIEKIANNVLNKISATPSWDFKYCYGVQNWTDKIEMSPEFESNIAFENKYDAGYLSDGLIYKSKERKNVEANERTDCLSFLLLCLDLSHLIIDVASRLIG